MAHLQPSASSSNAQCAKEDLSGSESLQENVTQGQRNGGSPISHGMLVLWAGVICVPFKEDLVDWAARVGE